MADDDSGLPLPQNYIDAVKRFEGFTPKASWDVNNYRNGYGTNALYPGEAINQDEATARLHRELGTAAGLVDARYPGLPEGHRAALTSLTYNAGPGWMNQGLGAAVGAGDWGRARDLLLGYNHSAGRVLPGLTDRRNTEASWMYGEGGPPGAPTPAASPSLPNPAVALAQAQVPSAPFLPGAAQAPGAAAAPASPAQGIAGDIQREGQDLLNPNFAKASAMPKLQLPPAFRPRVAPFQHQLATLKAPLFFPRG
jgi:lysozyme